MEASISTSPPNTCGAASSSPATCKPFSSRVILDPDGCLAQDTREKLKALNLKFDDVFNPSISNTMVQAAKLRPLSTLASPFLFSEKAGFPSTTGTPLRNYKTSLMSSKLSASLQKPEQVNVHVEYLKTSFLVKKPNGGSRIVTTFGEVAQYSKPQPSLIPNDDGVLREIGKWRYLVITDLLKSFYQIPLAHSSMKYCGAVTSAFTLVPPWECLGPKLSLKN